MSGKAFATMFNLGLTVRDHIGSHGSNTDVATPHLHPANDIAQGNEDFQRHQRNRCELICLFVFLDWELQKLKVNI